MSFVVVLANYIIVFVFWGGGGPVDDLIDLKLWPWLCRVWQKLAVILIDDVMRFDPLQAIKFPVSKEFENAQISH